MTLERLEVLHAGGHVGAVDRAGQRLTFIYRDDWRARNEATPLSVSMPLTAGAHPKRVVEPFLWGLLPDNEAVLRRWRRELGAPGAGPFGLLAALGEDLPGAMMLVRPERVDAVLEARGDVEWLTEEDVAELLRTVRRDHTAWLGPSAEGRWSLAGAQAKIALLREGDRWGRPSGAIATTHILKPAIAALDDHDLNEHLCLRAAARLGLRVARTSVAEFAGERAIVVERYDRRRDDGRLTRLHQEDLCQALAVHPSRKYESDGGPGPADVAEAIRSHIRPHEHAEAGVAAFADALAFNWLIAGPDAHSKNYAFLLAGSQVRSAPLYDVASALPYDEFYEPKVHLAMKIGGHYRLASIGRAAWERTAEVLALDAEALITRVAELSERTPDAFADVCRSSDIADLGSPLPARLLDAVRARALRCRRLLTA